MRPGGRLAAVVELLDLIDTDRRPADMIVRDYFRQRRYAGSKDRAAVAEAVFGVLRRRAELDWRVRRGGGEAGNRLRAFLSIDREQLEQALGDDHAPAPPSKHEAAVLAAGRGVSGEMPPGARLNLPDWLVPKIVRSLPDASPDELAAAFAGRADVSIRVNGRKTDRAALAAELLAQGVETSAHPWVPTALTLTDPKPLEHLPAFTEGQFEIQDAGSQYAGLMVDARPGMRVADICAGAGGKALLLADRMDGEGELLASDVDGRRLRRLETRAVRAGVSNIGTTPVGANAPWPEGWEASMDRVLIDAPCSGSGTWRRQPEQRWRFTPERLTELTRLQAEILDRGARLVKPGGRLVYVTCSFLREENETGITSFLDRAPEFRLLPWPDVVREAGIPVPSGNRMTGDFMRLSPFDHGVDGFFAAVLQRAIG